MSKIKTTFFFLIFINIGFTQISSFNTNVDNLFSPDYYHPKRELVDSISQLITENNLIDSSSITYISSFNLEYVRRNNNIISDQICLYLDSIRLDTLIIKKVKRRLMSSRSKRYYGVEYYDLIKPLRLSINFFDVYFPLCFRVYEKTDLQSNEVYFNHETDRNKNYKFNEVKYDDDGMLWVNVSFDCKSYEREREKNGGYTPLDYKITGWTLYDYIQFGLNCQF